MLIGTDLQFTDERSDDVVAVIRRNDKATPPLDGAPPPDQGQQRVSPGAPEGVRQAVPGLDGAPCLEREMEIGSLLPPLVRHDELANIDVA
jgi:hypothetical protein